MTPRRWVGTAGAVGWWDDAAEEADGWAYCDTCRLMVDATAGGHRCKAGRPAPEDDEDEADDADGAER